ncbi:MULTISPECIES: pectate lyase [unclassified Uliginosibacterium]|uniref:pectate lyase n=1 Tax=unclassified Uliginosibacterium TaxID=2621521 RepID=UPI000C79EE60|nr:MULTISPECIES: pectate lyase [unclassified Uliginosibacterium]MDO6386768.1 hypothetical protein [Uliginosibacterium sp. 31-12]PLK50586.1 pectate lyase [Uliginosibacterium sp. TH139]
MLLKPIVTVLLAAILIPAAQALPAFPGAEGFGANASGGRGGKVIYVTNLKDSGSGSLRWALLGWGARTIVFKVGGEIQLESPLKIDGSNVTIAGQTAPGDGITLRGAPLIISGSNIIVRYLRVRMGSTARGEHDAVSITDGHDIILDHLSASWSIDETLSPSGPIRDITIQWSIISESLNYSHHKKGAHGYGSLLRATGGVSLHHNLWAHHRGRNPRFGDNYGGMFNPTPTFDFRNNVIYDWGDYASGMVDGDIRVNYVANYLKPGPDTKLLQAVTFTDGVGPKTRFHVTDNLFEGHPELSDPEGGRFFGLSTGEAVNRHTLSKDAFAAPPLTTQSASEAYALVLSKAGASLARDGVDQRVIQQVRSGTGRLINDQEDVGGWPALAGGPAPLDSDEDGLPDEWENAHGLDPQNPKDSAAPHASGYTWLEVYLSELAAR